MLEGQNRRIEYRYAEGRAEGLPEFTAELVWLNADLIVAAVTPAALRPSKRPAPIPIRL